MTTTLAANASLSLDQTYTQPLGRQSVWYPEADERLNVAAAAAAYEAGRFNRGHAPVLTFGIGARPVWVRLAVNNPTDQPLQRRLTIDTAWLDQVDVYIRRDSATVAEYHAGDSYPFDQRAVYAPALCSNMPSRRAAVKSSCAYRPPIPW